MARSDRCSLTRPSTAGCYPDGASHDLLDPARLPPISFSSVSRTPCGAPEDVGSAPGPEAGNRHRTHLFAGACASTAGQPTMADFNPLPSTVETLEPSQATSGEAAIVRAIEVGRQPSDFPVVDFGSIWIPNAGEERSLPSMPGLGESSQRLRPDE